MPAVLLLLLVSWVCGPTEGQAAPKPGQPQAAASAEAPPSDLEGLRREVVALQALTAGGLPEGFAVASLFEVDLLDETAVAARRETLRREVAALEAAVSQPPPAAAKNGSGKAEPARDEDADLRLERARLRLAFLGQSLETRSALVAADRQRTELEDRRRAAQIAASQAEEQGRRAEQERQAALEEARKAADAVSKALAAERARVEAARGVLAGLHRDLAEVHREAAERSAARLLQARDLSLWTAAPELTPADADALYDDTVSVLVGFREQLSLALVRLESPRLTAAFSPELDLDSAPYKDAPERSDLLERIASVREEEERLRREERENRLREASDLVRDVAAVNELRIGLIPRLSLAKRESVLGLTREGLAQLGREARHVLLMARWYPVRLLNEWRTLGSRARDLFAVGKASWIGLQEVALLAAALIVRRRYRNWLKALRRLAVARVQNRALNLVADRWLRFFGAVAGELGLLAFLYLFFGVLGSGTPPELDVLRAVVIGYAWYRFSISAVHHAVASAAGIGGIAVPPELNRRILGSVRTVARYGYAVAVLLILSHNTLGRGYLYTLVVRFFWLGALPLAFVLIQRWRTDIADAYLRLYPEGRFARAVEATRHRPDGFFVAAAAFCAVAARGLTLYGQEAMLRFEQTRRALAFLFRRRLEKRAESVGLGSSDVAVLPEALRDAFEEGPVSPELAIPRYPHLEEARERIADWTEGRLAQAVALVGERGIGKTSWLAELARSSPAPAMCRILLTDRLTTAPALCRHLGQELGLGRAETVTDLARAACAAPRRVVLLDQAQNLMLRAPGGLEGYEAFAELVAGTSASLFWVCSFSKYAWEHLGNVYRGRDLFRAVHRLDTWPEEDIGALIAHRMGSVGCRASYEDLVVDRVDGTEFQSEVIRTGERYRRLLWDYADGNPRVAVHFWLRSLIPDGMNRVRVRLFAAPSAEELDALGEQSRFLLAAIVTHENLSLQEAARVLRYPRHLCEAALNYLVAQGLLEFADGRYRVTVHWNRAVLRFLRRKHLLFS